MHPSRRTVLVVGAVGLVTACTTEPPRVVTDDERRASEAAIREDALIQLYDAALTAFPTLSPVLAPLREDHVQHRSALVALRGPVAAASTSTPPVVVGRTPAAARQQIEALERATATSHAASSLRAGRSLAPVLASLSACEATHVALL